MWKIGAADIANFPIPIPPLAVQRVIAEKVTAERAKIIREREAADRLAEDTEAAVEAMILGVRKVSI